MSKFIRAFAISFAVTFVTILFFVGSCQAQLYSSPSRSYSGSLSGDYNKSTYSLMSGSWQLKSINNLVDSEVECQLMSCRIVVAPNSNPERGVITVTSASRCLNIDTCAAQAQQKPQSFLWPGTINYYAYNGSPIRFQRNGCQVDSGGYGVSYAIQNGKTVMLWIGPKLSITWERI